LECNHPFIINLFRTFQNDNSIYMLLELVQGGELWTLLYQNQSAIPRTKLGGYTTAPAQFYSACVISCFQHVHSLGVAYRDLKPENLLLGANGYLKMVDFGFAKKIPYYKGRVLQSKSFTLCGTPEYLSPELVLSQGHNQGVDWW
jgi:serine/threonine protein kinase